MQDDYQALCNALAADHWAKREALEAPKCGQCGCLLDDHFVPDWYDPRTQEAYADGHLNTCGDCRECFSDEEA